MSTQPCVQDEPSTLSLTCNNLASSQSIEKLHVWRNDDVCCLLHACVFRWASQWLVLRSSERWLTAWLTATVTWRLRVVVLPLLVLRLRLPFTRLRFLLPCFAHYVCLLSSTTVCVWQMYLKDHWGSPANRCITHCRSLADTDKPFFGCCWGWPLFQVILANCCWSGWVCGLPQLVNKQDMSFCRCI